MRASAGAILAKAPGSAFRRGEEDQAWPRARRPPPELLGDADVGAGANIGAGTITCNYDGIQIPDVIARALHRLEHGAGRAGQHRQGRLGRRRPVITRDVPGRRGARPRRQTEKQGARSVRDA